MPDDDLAPDDASAPDQASPDDVAPADVAPADVAPTDVAPADASAPAVPAPHTDGVGSRLRQARVRAKLLGEALRPVTIDRFTILGPLGAGGMGEVYAAYDDQLERKVALKLVRAGAGADPAANAKLLEEAKALARLAHPNVVALYEVGQAQGRVFLAMELVRGKPLTEWLADARDLPPRRRAREVLQLFLAAGRGLGAAHRAGLCHRDVKPGNLVVGDDGRVRVVDFGLATAEARHGDAPRATVAGTPRYMAPEQLASGQPGDAKSDQWSFCLALAEALCGAEAITAALGDAGAPTGDAAVRALHDAIARAGLPSAVRRALWRGLSAAPAQRYPDLDAVVSALEAWPRRRARARAIAAGLVGALLVAWLAARRPAPPPRVACDSGAGELASTWSPARRTELTAALTPAPRSAAREAPSAQAYRDEGRARVLTALTDYAGAWAAERDRACRAYHHGGESAGLYDRRVACLARRRAELAGAVDVLLGGGLAIDRAIEVTAALPDVAPCGDPARLLATTALPTDDVARQRVAALQARLARARSLEAGGAAAEAAAELSRSAAEAEALAYPPLIAQVSLAQARVAIAASYDGCAACREPLSRALTVGLEAGLDDVVVEALARLIFVESSRPDAPPDAPADAPLSYLPIAEALSRRLPDRQFVSALLANNVGVHYLGRGDLARARAQFERSVAQAAEASLDIELLRARTNVAMVTPDPRLRRARMDQAISATTTRLGPRHSLTLRQRIVAALYTPSPARAHAELTAACDELAAVHEPTADWPTYCLYHRGLLELELSRADEAAAHLADFAGRPANGSALSAIAEGYAHLLRGAAERAEAAFARAEQLAGSPDPRPARWWSAAAPALAMLGRGEALWARKQSAAAAAVLGRALDLLEGLCARSFAVEYAAQRARAQRLLALAQERSGLRPGGPPNRWGKALRAAAGTYYREAGAGYEGRVREIEEGR